MIKGTPKPLKKRRQNPWYKNQVSSLDGKHSRLADKVHALKAYANSTELSLRETQQELAFAIDAVRELTTRLKTIESHIWGGNPHIDQSQRLISSDIIKSEK